MLPAPLRPQHHSHDPRAGAAKPGLEQGRPVRMHELRGPMLQGPLCGDVELVHTHEAQSQLQAIIPNDLLVEPRVHHRRGRQDRGKLFVAVSGAPMYLRALGPRRRRASCGARAAAPSAPTTPSDARVPQRSEHRSTAGAGGVVGAVELRAQWERGVHREGLGDKPPAAPVVADVAHVSHLPLGRHQLEVLRPLPGGPHLEVRVPELPVMAAALYGGGPVHGLHRNAAIHSEPRRHVVDVDPIACMLLEQDRGDGGRQLL
mmetsp:Transcript_35487/g.102210  ORF Transcript_35487/g.102210 Transcript_35487/m.102210 type:complete len:260 (-) Transcript_35487:35-814(-)